LTRYGWAYLSPVEKLTLLRQIEDDVLELEVFVKLARDNRVSASADEASYVARISKYVPDDLRARFDDWVLKRFDTLGRAIHFDTSDIDDRARRDIVEVLALARDPRLETEAVQGRVPANTWFAPLGVTLAANSSASLRTSLLDELANRSSGNAPRRKTVIEGLSKTRGLVGVLKSEPKRLDDLSAWDGLDLFANVCSASDRKDLVDLLNGKMVVEFTRILGRIDKCIATKAQLDAGFRSWLSSLSP
jgi:hypothetical protein